MLINWFTVFAQIVNFLILVYLLKRFLYGPIIRTMEERERKIASAMERAEKAEEEANRRSQELLSQQQALEETRSGFLAEVKQEVEAWRDRTVKEARLEIDRLRRSWIDRLNRDKAVFLDRLRAQVANHILRIGEKVLHELANRNLEEQIIAVFLERVAGEKNQFEREDLAGRVLVQSGFELGEEASGRIHGQLSDWFPHAGPIQFEVTDNLGMGIQVGIGDRKVAWNLCDYLEGLEKEILSDLHAAGQEEV